MTKTKKNQISFFNIFRKTRTDQTLSRAVETERAASDKEGCGVCVGG